MKTNDKMMDVINDFLNKNTDIPEFYIMKLNRDINKKINQMLNPRDDKEIVKQKIKLFEKILEFLEEGERKWN
jgi:3-deoxy-D-manno-octulosonic acid (KDO) 8-phosphate synthase